MKPYPDSTFFQGFLLGGAIPAAEQRHMWYPGASERASTSPTGKLPSIPRANPPVAGLLTEKQCKVSGRAAVVARRAPVIRRFHWIYTVLLWLTLLFGGCSYLDPIIASFQDEESSGIPAEDAASVSRAVAKLRELHPDLSGLSIPHSPRTAPDTGKVNPVLPVLVGDGIDVANQPRVRMTLHLEKNAYARGRLELAAEDGSLQQWPIIAFDHQGRADGEFEFIYLLAPEDFPPSYLVLIGGTYDDGQTKRWGLEGTLIVPAASGAVEPWRQAYKIDFGYEFPVVPEYQSNLESLNTTLDALLEGLEIFSETSEELAALTLDLAGLGGDDKETRGTLRAKIRMVDQQLSQQLTAMENGAEAWIKARKELANQYAEFSQSNAYNWAKPDRQREYFSLWSESEALDLEFEQAFAATMRHTKRKREFKAMHQDLQDAIARLANKERRPLSP